MGSNVIPGVEEFSRRCENMYIFQLVRAVNKLSWNRTVSTDAPLLILLLLARYVPNVAKRSIWHQCKKKYILRTDRPTSNLAHIGEVSNGHISARGHPIHFMFDSTVGFSGSADRMALFPVSPNPRWRLLGKFKWRYLSSGSSDLLCLVLGWGFRGRRIEWR